MSYGRWFPAVALVAFACASCRAGEAAPSPGPEDEIRVRPGQIERGEVEVVEAREQDVPASFAAAGRVAFDDARVQHVFSPVAGRVSRVLARPGQRVRRGDGLVALLAPEVGAALADVEKAEADRAQASAERDRQRRLVAAGAGPLRDLDAAEDAWRRADAELARARQRASLFRSGSVDAVTQELTLRSALDGEVIARAVAPGMELQGAYAGGAPVELFTVGDIDRVWVLADVPEQDLSRARVGAEVGVRVAAWPDRIFHGRVEWMGGALDPGLHTGRVRIGLSNAGHLLKPEMLAQVSIATPARRALVLPRRALVEIEDGTYAYVGERGAEDGRLRFQRRRLQLGGAAGEGLVAVERGVAAGQPVLVERGARREIAAGDLLVSQRQMERAGIRVEAAREQEVGGLLTVGARLAFDDVRVAHVFSPVNGRVSRIFADPGQHVKKGSPLLAILSPDVGSAFAEAVKAEADLVVARRELERQRDLVAAHAGARRDLEAVEGSWRKASAEARRAQLKVRLLSAGSWDAVTQEYTLRAPMDGEVVARAATPGLEVQGQWSSAGAPAELFTVGSLDPLWAMGDVYEMDLPLVRAGQEVTLEVPAFPGRAFRGTVDSVSDVLDPASRTAKIRCLVPNPGRLLRPEMAPVLSVALPARRRLAIPRDSVLRLGDETVVFVAAASSPPGQLAFRRRRVIVGEDLPGGMVPVRDGIAAGERIVVSGGIFLVGLL